METLFSYFSAEKLVTILNSIYIILCSPAISAFIHAIETFCQKADTVLFILFMGALYKFSILLDSENAMFIPNIGEYAKKQTNMQS